MFVTKKMPRSLSAEAYRSLRTSIKLYSVDNPLKTLVVTSSISSEGKSTVTGNLAYILNQDGAKVVVIDCNLRNPSMHLNFFIPNDNGLTDILSGSCELEKAMKKVEDSLFLITAGSVTNKPSEILGSHSMQELLDELSTNFDYIIMDTSAVLPSTDTLLLSARADGTIIVVRARKSKSKVVKLCYEQLMEVKANVIGTILNESNKFLDNKYYDQGKSKKIKIFNK